MISGEAQFQVKGDVGVVLNGKVKPDATPSLNLNEIPYALGAGRFSDPHFFGESIVLNGVAWGTQVQPNGALHTERAMPAFTSPFLLGIKVLQPPPALVIYQNTSAIELFEELLPSFTLGYAFLADAVFGVFEGAYLKKSPIFGENINVHQNDYWHRDEALENVQAFLFGVVLSEEGKKRLPNYAQAFYHNPNEKIVAPFSAHTHAALCETHRPPSSFSAFQNLLLTESITNVRHFLTQSVIKQASFALFNLQP